MTLIQKNDVNQIFAINAPDKDKPASFANYPNGWDASRSNNGKPTIKQFNYLQQRTDQNILWIHQNGGALPYDENMEYAEGAPVVKNGELVQKSGNDWKPVFISGLIKTFESIADLITIQNPKSGQVVDVLSYNLGQGEGGDNFIYKPSRQLENDGVSIFNGWERQKNGRSWTPEDAGAKHNGTYDDAQAFLKLINLAKKSHLNVSCSPSVLYQFKSNVWVEGMRGLTINFNGSSTNVNIPVKSMNPLGFVFVESATTVLIIKGLKQSGADWYYDMYAEQDPAKQLACTGIYAENATNVYIENLEQKKLLGVCAQFSNYKNIVINNWTAIDVSGDNEPDSTGDLLYLGKRNGVSHCTVNNVTCKAQISARDNLKSRIFCTVENLDLVDYIDTETYVTVNNFHSEGHQRFFHVEANKGRIFLNTDNGYANTGCGLFQLVSGQTTWNMTNTTVVLDNQGYKGTNTLNRAGRVIVGAGSIIDGVNTPDALLGLFTDTEENKTIVSAGAKVINVKGKLIVTGNYELHDGSEIEFAGDNFQYHYDQRDSFIKGAKIKGIGSNILTNTSDFVLIGCDIENMSFKKTCFHQEKSKLDLSTAASNYNKNMTESRYADIYLDDKLINKFDQLQPINGESPYTSANDLVYVGAWYMEVILLTDIPAGWTKLLIETKIGDDRIPATNTLLQTATNFENGAVMRRTRNYQSVWSEWV